MKLTRKLAIVIFLLSPMAANATLITVHYMGEVTGVDGSGFGYSVGDTISGWFEYDSDDWFDNGNFLRLIGPLTSNTGDGGYANANDGGIRRLLCLPFLCDDALTDSSRIDSSAYLYDVDGNEIGYTSTYGNFEHSITWGTRLFGDIENYTKKKIATTTLNANMITSYMSASVSS